MKENEATTAKLFSYQNNTQFNQNLCESTTSTKKNCTQINPSLHKSSQPSEPFKQNQLLEFSDSDSSDDELNFQLPQTNFSTSDSSNCKLIPNIQPIQDSSLLNRCKSFLQIVRNESGNFKQESTSSIEQIDSPDQPHINLELQLGAFDVCGQIPSEESLSRAGITVSELNEINTSEETTTKNIDSISHKTTPLITELKSTYFENKQKPPKKSKKRKNKDSITISKKRNQSN